VTRCTEGTGSPLRSSRECGRPVTPPAALLAQVESAAPTLALLVGGARDQPARHRTLRAAIARSYDLPAPAEQALLRRLAVSTGGFTLAAAAALVRGSELDVRGPRSPSSSLERRAWSSGYWRGWRGW
jgi:hypothetical protein